LNAHDVGCKSWSGCTAPNGSMTYDVRVRLVGYTLLNTSKPIVPNPNFKRE